MQRIVFAVMLGFASALSLAGARAADDPFSVSGIAVDATASSASVAQYNAINEGRARAWTMLYRKLTKSQDWGRQPVVDDITLQRMIRSYLPSNERRSTTRYVATMTYVFNPDAVRRLLRTQNVPYVDMDLRPVLVVAMAPGYSPHSAWAQLWANRKPAGGAVPILPPLGDALDAQALGALNFATAQWQDVEPAASRVHASEAYLVQVIPGKGTIAVAIRLLGPGQAPPIPNVVVPIRPGQTGPQAYGAAAEAAASAIIDAAKSRSAIDFSKRFRLTADAHIGSLADWGLLMQKLGTVPTITGVEVLAMNEGEARIVITYVGSPEQLAALAAQSNLDLSNDSGSWQLTVQAATPTPMPAPQ